MGYELRRQLREALGPDITGLQRAVALEIADDAREDTRTSWAGLEDLARWTGAKDTNVVRNALKRLAAAGWEFRIPIGKGRDGRLLYAVPGRRMTFKVPPFAIPEGIATATPKGEQGLPHGVATATPKSPEGVATAHSEGAVATPEGATATPYSSDSSDPSSQQEGPDSQRDDYGIPDFARPLVDGLSSAGVIVRWPFAGGQWLVIHALIKKSGVQAMVDHARKAAARTNIESAKYFMQGWRELPPLPRTSPSDRPQQQHGRPAGPEKPPHCGDIDCDEISRMRETETPDGFQVLSPCHQCHPNARKEQPAA